MFMDLQPFVQELSARLTVRCFSRLFRTLTIPLHRTHLQNTGQKMQHSLITSVSLNKETSTSTLYVYLYHQAGSASTKHATKKRLVQVQGRTRQNTPQTPIAGAGGFEQRLTAWSSDYRAHVPRNQTLINQSVAFRKRQLSPKFSNLISIK